MVPSTEPLVSVIIATHNCAQYVGAAVESVLAQTYPNVEVQVVNDGSTDNTADVLARYDDNPRVHCHEQANAGQTSAKNRGIREARGEFIAFCDADDMWLPDKLAVQMPGFRQNDTIGVVYSRAIHINEHGQPLDSDIRTDRCVSGRIAEALFTYNIIPFGTAVVRRRCFEEMGAFDERYRMGIDWELWLRLSTRYEFFYVDAPTYLYRVWSRQMSRNWQGRYEATFRIMTEFLERYPGVISSSVIRQAWADCFVQRARIRAVESKEYLLALADLGKALRWNPGSCMAWKSFGFLVYAAAGQRRS